MDKDDQGYPGSSAGKESACKARDPGSIPGSGRSPGEGIGYPLQYSWASLVAQLVKNPPAMWKTSVRSLDWEDPLEKGKATHFRVLAWRIPWTQKSRTRLSGFHFDFSRVSWAWGFGGRLMVYAQHCSLNSYICLLNNLSCPSLSPFTFCSALRLICCYCTQVE